MIWKEIPSLPGWFASDEGDIRRAERFYGRRRFRERTLKANDDGKGYLVVTVVIASGVYKLARVHKLVCEAFHGVAPPGKPLALHGDGDSKNNRSSNLRWGTYEENEADKLAHGARLNGERNPLAKLTEDAVRHIRSSQATLASLASRYGVTETAISYARLGRNWKHVE